MFGKPNPDTPAAACAAAGFAAATPSLCLWLTSEWGPQQIQQQPLPCMQVYVDATFQARW